jgi:hypothetical protein
MNRKKKTAVAEITVPLSDHVDKATNADHSEILFTISSILLCILNLKLWQYFKNMKTVLVTVNYLVSMMSSAACSMHTNIVDTNICMHYTHNYKLCWEVWFVC